MRSSKVLVLTQADRCLWSEQIHNYLVEDPLRELWSASQSFEVEGEAWLFSSGIGAVELDPGHRLQEMSAQDARLKAWLGSTREGAAALDHFADEGVDLRVCATSALGSQPIGNTLHFPWRPRCVLDPLLWALEMTSL
jgi:hypothetical protein